MKRPVTLLVESQLLLTFFFTQNQGTAAIVSDLFSSSSDDVTAANVGKAICQPERAIYGWSAD